MKLPAIIFSVLTAASPAVAGAVRICNESGSDLGLNFVWQQSIDPLTGMWRSSGPDLLRNRSCNIYFKQEVYYRARLNARVKNFFGVEKDHDLANNPSVMATNGKAEASDARLCLSRIGPNDSYNTGSIEFFADCPAGTKSVFGLWIVKEAYGSVDIILR